MKFQRHDQLVYLHDFVIDDEFTYDGVYPKGAREKMGLIAPTDVPYDFLIGGHRYLFKKSFRRYPHQFWMEIVAYRIGCLMGVEVPPAFVAYESNSMQFGALIEWFYGYPGFPKQAYHDGGVYMKQLIENYDMRVGEQHNFTTIAVLMKAMFQLKMFSGKWHEVWARIFVFDAVIGNTDRHHDNWGIIWTYDDTAPRRIKGAVSPAFDNGTSLGYEIIENNIHNFKNSDRLNRYISKGRHHAKWNREDSQRLSHLDFIRKYVEKYPDTANIIKNCLSFDYDELEQSVYQLTEFDVQVPLTTERAEFILDLVDTRRNNLLSVVGN